MNTFFTADTHFGHTRILKFCRPRYALWQTIEQHNQGLIDRWNERVGPDDTIFHLGDFAFFGKNKIKEVVEQLNGKIILISGNHDSFKTVKTVGFNSIFNAVVHRIGNQKIAMAHQPEYMPWRDIPWNPEGQVSFGLCGHVHEGWKYVDNGELIWYNRETNPYTEMKMKIPGTIINVGVDQWNFAPVSFEEIMSLVQSLEK